MEEVSEEKILEDVKELIKEVKPEYNMSDASLESRRGKYCSGYAYESMFAFGKHGYYWIVFLCAPGSFAYKRITADWVRYYSDLILLSPVVFVKFKCCHKIVKWAVLQDKEENNNDFGPAPSNVEPV